jgi:hypothetical protein
MKSHECARRLGACLVFGCACLYAARGHADWEATPDIRLEAEMNDNPALNTFGSTDTQVIDSASRMLADAVLRISNVEPRGELVFEPRVRSDAYVEEEAQLLESTDVFLRSNGVHRGQTVQIGYRADLARERIVGIEFLDTLPTDTGPDDTTAVITSPVGLNEKRTRIGVSPYLEIAMSSRGTLALEGRIVDVDYVTGTLSGGRTDFLERAIGGEYRRALRGQRGTLGVRVFATGYEASVNANTTDTRGFELTYGRDMSELWSWNIAVGTQRSDYAVTTAGRRVRGTDDTPIWAVGVRKTAQRSSMRAELMHRMTPDALGYVAPRDELRVAWERAMTARVNGGLVLRGVDAEGPPTVPGSSRRYGRLELDIEWQLRPTWSLVAGYAHATARSTATIGDSAESNALTIGIRYRGLSQQRADALAP